jgi:hypothetical protein
MILSGLNLRLSPASGVIPANGHVGLVLTYVASLAAAGI